MQRWPFALLLFVFLSLNGTAQVYNPRANLTNVTIQAAVNNALSGDSLCVSTGVFDEFVDIYSKNLFLDGKYSNTFQGKNPNGKTIIRGVPTKGPVFVIDESVVTFADLEITGGSMSTYGNGGGLCIQNGSAVTALNCRIYGNVSMGFGGGAYVTQSTAYFLNTPVYSNTALNGTFVNGCGGGMAVNSEGRVVLDGSSAVYANQAAVKGGGLFVQNAMVGVTNSDADIKLNHAPHGGGVAVTQGVFRISNNADITDNTAAFAGGGIFLEDSSTGIVEGIGTSIGYLVPGLSMGPNQVTNGNGGGIYASHAQLLIRDFGRVSHNHSSSNGGGLYLVESTGIFNNASIGYEFVAQIGQTNSAAFNGGGLYASSSKVVFSNETTLRSGKAGYDGGGIYATNSQIYLSWNTWIGDTNALGANEASHMGGGISLHHSTLNADVVTFWHNLAGDGGGALHMDSGSYASGQVLYAKANAVDDTGLGGVLFAAGGSRFDFRNSSFNNNTSDYCGGAIYFAGLFPGPTSTLYSCNLFGNKTDRDGGAIYIGGPGVLEIVDGYMDWNTADADDNNVGDGGVFYVSAMADLSIDVVNDWGARFNSARNGGVFALEDEAAVYLTAADGVEIKADQNSSAGNGGCASLPNGTAIFEAAGRVLIEDNWAGGNGGGIYASGTHFVNLSFDGVTNRPSISGNSASNMGGGIFMSGGILTINNADIGTITNGNKTRIDNSSGGGVYVCDGATLFAQNAVFAGNSCDDAGAGLAVVEAGALIGAQFTAANRSLLPLSQFICNVATGGESTSYGGGGLFVAEGAAYVEDTLFAGNASHRGGGVYGGPSSFLALQNCVVASNKGLLATSVGSGIRLFAATSLVTQCTVAFNERGGIEANEVSALRMTNSIVYDNTRTNVSAGQNITYSDIGGGYPGTGNIDANPRFYNPTNLDFRLLYGSPCTNAGTVMLVDHDCIDEERPLHGGYDMGAYEYNGLKMDSDRDTMADEWEILHSLNPLNTADGGVDSDDDTYLNSEEYIADTDPWSDTNYLHLTRIAESNGMHTAFESSIRRVYSLYACDQAITGAWTAVAEATNVLGNGSLLELTDGDAEAKPRLYRIGVEVP